MVNDLENVFIMVPWLCSMKCFVVDFSSHVKQKVSQLYGAVFDKKASYRNGRKGEGFKSKAQQCCHLFNDGMEKEG